MIANTDPFIRKFNELDFLCRKNRETILSIWRRRYPEKWNASSEEERFKLGKGFKLMKCLAELLPEMEEETLKVIINVRNTIHDVRNLFEPTKECIKFLDGIITEIQNGNISAIDSSLANVKKSNIQQMKSMIENVGYKAKPLQYEGVESIKQRLYCYMAREEEASTMEEAKDFFAQFKNFFNSIPRLPEVRKARERINDIRLEKAKREVLRELDEDYYDALQEIKEELRGFKQRSAEKLLKEKYARYKMQIESCIDEDELEDIDIDLDCYDY